MGDLIVSEAACVAMDALAGQQTAIFVGTFKGETLMPKLCVGFNYHGRTSAKHCPVKTCATLH